MKRTFFDKVVVIIMLLLIGVFIALGSYTTYATQKALVTEKQDNLINEANLLSEQTIVSYVQGITSLDYLQVRFNEFEDSLKTSVWYFDSEGKLIVASNPQNYPKLPGYLNDIDESINSKKAFTLTGDFYGIFDNTMISIGLPVYTGTTQNGFLILHTSMTELDSLQNDMLNIMYMPFLVMILVVGVVLAYLSGTVR